MGKEKAGDCCVVASFLPSFVPGEVSNSRHGLVAGATGEPTVLMYRLVESYVTLVILEVMNTNTTYIFGYGSLLNDQSRLRSAPYSTVVERYAKLQGFQRIFDIAYGDSVYANIKENPNMNVVGVVMDVTHFGFEKLKERERMYEAIDITDKLEGDWERAVYAFIGQDNTQGGETIKQSYLDLCLSGVKEEDREKWMEETILNFPIDYEA